MIRTVSSVDSYIERASREAASTSAQENSLPYRTNMNIFNPETGLIGAYEYERPRLQYTSSLGMMLGIDFNSKSILGRNNLLSAYTNDAGFSRRIGFIDFYNGQITFYYNRNGELDDSNFDIQQSTRDVIGDIPDRLDIDAMLIQLYNKIIKSDVWVKKYRCLTLDVDIVDPLGRVVSRTAYSFPYYMFEESIRCICTKYHGISAGDIVLVKGKKTLNEVVNVLYDKEKRIYLKLDNDVEMERYSNGSLIISGKHNKKIL